MHSHRHPHHIAVRAILFAIGLPIVVFMFGAIRNRQLQSTANPRWAEFAKVTGPSSIRDSQHTSTRPNSIKSATIRTTTFNSTKESDVFRMPVTEPDLVVSGFKSESIQAPLRFEGFRSISDPFERFLAHAEGTEQETGRVSPPICFNVNPDQQPEDLSDKVQLESIPDDQSSQTDSRDHDSDAPRTGIMDHVPDEESKVRDAVPTQVDTKTQIETDAGNLPTDQDFVPPPPIVFRPVDEESNTKIANQYDRKAFDRLESELAALRKRLDQIAERQVEHQNEDSLRGAQLLESMKSFKNLVSSADDLSSTQKGSDDLPDDKKSADQLIDEILSKTNPIQSERPDDKKPVGQLVDEILQNPDPPKLEKPESQVPADHPKSIESTVDIAANEVPSISLPIPSDTKIPVATSEPAPETPTLIHKEKESDEDSHQNHVTRESTSPTTLDPQTQVPVAAKDERIRIQRDAGADGSDLFSMNVQDVDIRSFFSKLSEVARVSVLLSPEITGQITLTIHQARFDATMKAILKSRRYVFTRDDDIIIISTVDEAARLKHSDRKLAMKIYLPNYLSSEELNQLIEPLLSPDGRHSITTSARRGLVRTVNMNIGDESYQRDTVIVQDVPEVLSQIDRILVDLDVPPLQVNIEAKILCVRLAGGFKHGIDLGRLPCRKELGVSNAEGGLKYASLSDDLPTFIQSIERLADTSVVSSQRIQILNKHRAEMLIGDRIGYQSKPGDPVHFMESGTKLTFRPSISADGYIRMEIQPERSSVTNSRKSKLPQQNTTELSTHVLVRDGATVVIGGLISEQAMETTSRLPKISSIPIVGASFRHRNEQLQRTELILLVTPHIVTACDSEAEGTYLEQLALERADEFRNKQSRATRTHLAKAHYDRAAAYFHQGNYVKARQQIEASLRQDKLNLEAIQLRNEINRSCSKRTAR